MSLDELLAVADGARLELTPDAVEAIRDSRSVVESELASGRGVYGLNLGLGHMKNTRLPTEQLVELQKAMLDGHAGAIGPPLPARAVRAAMAARVNGFARGGSGASLACAETYVAMLNARVHPVVPGFGSVGASDLAQLAAIARVAIGGGHAEVGGRTMPAAEALGAAGIAVLEPQPKDGLALMSANAISVALGAINVARAMRTLEVAGIVAAVSVEAISGNVSPFGAEVAAAKGVEGQVRVSGHIRELMAGSDLYQEDPARSIQDPLSFRVVPQVHGAAWELVRDAGRAVQKELNAMTDNPLVSRRERRLISNGNFHPMLLALSFDALRPALAHVGQLSDRRMNHLWRATFAAPEGRPSDANRSVWGSSESRRGTSLRYSAAAAAAALRQTAEPATLDVVPLDLEVEDHATGAPLSVERTASSLARLDDVLAVELLLARDLIGPRGEGTRGAGTRAALEQVEAALGGLGNGAESSRFHAAVVELMRTDLAPAVARRSAPLAWSD